MMMTNSNRIKVIAVGKSSFNIIEQLLSQSMEGIDFMFGNRESEVKSSKNGLHTPAPNLQYNLLDKTVFDQAIDNKTQITMVLAVMNDEDDHNNALKIAQWSKEKRVFAIGMFAIPLKNAESTNYSKALIYIEELKDNCDSIVMIDYNKIKYQYTGIVEQSFIAMIRSLCESLRNPDINYHDIPKGEIFIGSATNSSPSRAKNAIQSAFDNALIPVDKLKNTDKVLLHISCGRQEITMDEIGLINDYILEQTAHETEIVMTVNEESYLEDAIKISLIISGTKIVPRQTNPFETIKTSIMSLDGKEEVIFENKQAVEERKNRINNRNPLDWSID